MSSQPTEKHRQAGVCITGMGVCHPLGRSALAVTQALLAGREAIGPARSVDTSGLTGHLVSEFDPVDHDLVRDFDRPFRLGADQMAALDRASWFALWALEEATLQARWEGHPFAAHRIGIVLGSSHAGIAHIERCFQAARAGEPVPRAWSAAAATGHTASVVARCLGADGARAVVSSACASSNTAVGIGADWLVQDLVDCVVVIGTDTVSPSILAGFSALRAISARPSAPFSTPAGITLGEGAGVLVLERESSARARGVSPLAWVRGYGLSGDAHHETAPDAEGHGVAAAMREALRDADLVGADIDYVSAHGTGTDANDRPEAIATARVVGAQTPLSSLKSSLGHTLGASGVIELIVTCLMAQEGFVPATTHFEGVRPGCPDLDYVPDHPRPLPVRHFLCNNFGFGGNNSSLVISRASGPCANRGPLQDVVLVGQGAAGGFGVGVHQLLESLWSGSCAPETGGITTAGGALSPRSFLATLDLPGNRRMSTLIRSAMAASQEALEQAGGRALVKNAPDRCALVAGIDHGALLHVEKFMASVFDDGLPYASATHFPLTTLNATGGQVSIAFGIKGYNTTFCGAGAALHYAHSLVRDGRQDRALMLAADEFSSLLGRALSGGAAVRVGDQERPGEGGGALVLESARVAIARGMAPLARLRSVAVSGSSNLGQDARAWIRVMRLALDQAGRTVHDVEAVIGISPQEEQRTGLQREALNQVFLRDVPTAWAQPAAGSMGSASLPLHVILAAEALRRQTLPPRQAGQRPIPLGTRGCVMVVHAGHEGEVHALVLETADPREWS